MADTPSKPDAEAEDDLHRKFREALDRKKEQNESHPGVSAKHEGVGDARNDKHQRQFRRKAGS
jgi:Family of unknown function (DUF5302)